MAPPPPHTPSASLLQPPPSSCPQCGQGPGYHVRMPDESLASPNPLLSVHRHDQSLTAVLMMNHSNLLDFKQKTRLLWFHGVASSPDSPPLPGAWERGGAGVLCLLHLILVAVLESPPAPHLISPCISTLSCPPRRLHGPLCVRACVRVFIPVARVTWGLGPGRRAERRPGPRARPCPHQPAACPSLLS